MTTYIFGMTELKNILELIGTNYDNAGSTFVVFSGTTILRP